MSQRSNGPNHALMIQGGHDRQYAVAAFGSEITPGSMTGEALPRTEVHLLRASSGRTWYVESSSVKPWAPAAESCHAPAWYGAQFAPLFLRYIRRRQEIDREGVVLPDLVAARARAVHFSGDGIKRFDEEIWNSPEWEVWVTDESGTTVCSLTVITKAIPIPGLNQG